jgi:outer membrane protein assembly factor BamE (lipoprotein component of BamABCDE complex)
MNRYLYFFVFLSICGCQPFVNHRGLNVEKRHLEQIHLQKTSKNEVREILGPPSLTSIFKVKPRHFERWFYIYDTSSQKSFFNPQITEKKILEINFDEKGMVSNIIHHDPNDCVDIKPDAQQTPSSGYASSLLRDVFGNVGRYQPIPSKK